jgi:hypothetical protein
MKIFRCRVLWSAVLAAACLTLMLAPGRAWAQVDLSGNWRPEPYVQLVPNGPAPGDFVGVPLNADGRAAAATANANEESEELNRQCQPWMIYYLLDGPFGMEFRPVADPLNGNHILAWRIEGTVDRPPLTIWIDGRAPPSTQAVHTWGGFATGEWHGSTLAVSITHLKDGWLLRNAAPASNQATVSLLLSREGNMLTETFIIHDPVYLSEAYPRARTLELTDVSQSTVIGTVNDCLPAEVLPELSDGYHAARFLPGKNPLLGSNPAENTMLDKYHIPPQIALGGAEQMYPEFRKVLRPVYTVPPGYCRGANCCTAGRGENNGCTAQNQPRAPEGRAPAGAGHTATGDTPRRGGGVQ